MAKHLTREENLSELSKDPLVCQIVRTIRLKYPNSKIYTVKGVCSAFLDIFPTGLSEAQCEELGKLVASDYSQEVARDDPDYPFRIDVFEGLTMDRVLDITDIRS